MKVWMMSFGWVSGEGGVVKISMSFGWVAEGVCIRVCIGVAE